MTTLARLEVCSHASERNPMNTGKVAKLLCSLLWASLFSVLTVRVAFAQQPAPGAPAQVSPLIANCPGGISFGETIQCSINSSGETDSYTFSASAGDKVLLTDVTH
jgi:hypothetical protein